MLALWGDIGFVVFVISCLLFTVTYLTMSKWFKSFMGVLIAAFLLSVDIICVYLGLRIWDIVLPGVDWLRLVIFWTLGLTMISAIIAFFQVQFSKRGEKLRKRLAEKYDDVNNKDNLEG